MCIGEQAKKLGTLKFCAPFILYIPGRDREPALGGESFELVARAICVLPGGRGAQVGSYEHANPAVQ